MRRMLDSLRKFRLPVLFDKHDYDAIKVAMSQEAKKSQIGGNHYSQMTIQPVYRKKQSLLLSRKRHKVHLSLQ